MQKLILLDGSCHYAGICTNAVHFLIWLRFGMIQSVWVTFVSLAGTDELLNLLLFGCFSKVICTFFGEDYYDYVFLRAYNWMGFLMFEKF